jgi:hypothetical protein
MKKISSFLLLMLAIAISANAKIWTVDNSGRVANFNNITAAITAAASGDTLLLGGSTTAYANITLTKRLVIIGTGYFLTENPNTIEYKIPTTINNVTFSTDSEGSVLMGITSTNITINTNDITVRRSNCTYQISITGSNNTFKQCFFSAQYGGYMNITGINNIIRNNYISGYAYNHAALNCGPSNIVENNVILGIITINSSTFGNNILRDGNATFTNCNPFNSICNAAQFGTENGNQSFVTMTSVFVASGTTDGKWKLSLSSPAVGAGWGGIDCGMYGGPDPYVLSGIPDIPVITLMSVAGRASSTQGLNVILNIRSNK